MPWNNWKEPASGGTENPDKQRNLGVSYTGLVAGYGWTDEVQTGAMLGTEGQSRALEAIKLNLTGDDAENYDIYYRVHSSNFG